MAAPFEQQPKESAKAFEAFSVYLNLGAERSLAAVGRKLGKHKALIERWSSKFGWPERVQAHAAHLAIVERQAVEAVARAKSAEWLKRQTDIREREWALHDKCMAAAEKALAAFMEKEKVYASLADIARIVEVASKMGRLASGLATDRTELTGEDGGPVQIEVSLALEKIYGAAGPPAKCGEVVEVVAEPNSRLQIADCLREAKSCGMAAPDDNSRSRAEQCQGGTK